MKLLKKIFCKHKYIKTKQFNYMALSYKHICDKCWKIKYIYDSWDVDISEIWQFIIK